MDRMGRTREEMMEAAEAEIRRVSDVLSKLETDLAHAVEHAEQIEDESVDTQEQAAAFSRRMEVAEQEIERLKQEVAEADDDLGRAQADWEYYSGEATDDDDADGDTGERLSVRDAALIWQSNGRDEDYRFGYTEDELRRATEE
jgi:septal ring factor EnvC (AmiA/AmiB activator)